MFDLIENNLLFFAALTFATIFLIWLGWKIRLWWKNFLFMLVRKRGTKAERKAVKLLQKMDMKFLTHKSDWLDTFLLMANWLNSIWGPTFGWKKRISIYRRNQNWWCIESKEPKYKKTTSWIFSLQWHGQCPARRSDKKLDPVSVI